MSSPSPAHRETAWTLRSLCARAGLSCDGVDGPETIPITSLVDDSRRVQPGSCFVAVRGESANGHRFVDDAVRAGAVAVIANAHEPISAGVAPVPVVRVDDTRCALSRLAAAYYGLLDEGVCPSLVGVTGTNGKTTVAWMLRSIFRATGRKAAVFGTIEYDLVSERCPAPLTTPDALTLCRHLSTTARAGADFAVLEVSSHALEQRRVDSLPFTVGVFTNLTGDHLDYHHSMERYLSAKRRLFEALPAGSTAVVNADDAAASEMVRQTKARIVRVGLDAHRLDVGATVQSADLSGTRFVLRTETFETAVHCPLVGKYNVLNALLAAATANVLGIDPIHIVSGLEGLAVVPGRLQSVDVGGHPVTVLVDYAHTDDALQHVLQAVRPLTRGRLICVFGCGGDRDKSKRPRMGAVAASLADVAFVTSDNPRSEDPQTIVKDILPGFDSHTGCRVCVEVDRRNAIEAAVAEAIPGDLVLIAGKGHETVQIVGDQVLAFDDAEVAREALAKVAVVEDVA